MRDDQKEEQGQEEEQEQKEEKIAKGRLRSSAILRNREEALSCVTVASLWSKFIPFYC